MRRLATATFICATAIATCSAAQAQTAPAPSAQGQFPGVKPKPVATQAMRPGVQAPADTANAMGQAERLALQSDLAWVGQYNGAITGDVSERMVNAIKEYQKLKGGKPTGVLNPQERAVLADTARRKQESVGWKIMTEPTSGARVGIPTKLVPQQTSDGNGSKWTSPTGTVQVVLSRRKEANPTTAALADREKKEPGRTVDYSVVKPDFFVLSGLQNLKKFYIRGTFRGDEVRILTILYDQATENTVEPVVIAMSSAFTAFPATLAAQPAPRRKVDYGTGLVASQDGAIIADREVTDGCVAITIPGFGHAERVAEDKERGLALLHIYGARGLKPLMLSGGNAKSTLDIVGIADPQSQGGGAGISNVKAQLTGNGSGDTSLAPAPGLGFSGAAALDGDGKFAGVVLLKPAMVAGAAAVPAAQAALVSVEATRAFLASHGVKPDGSSLDAKAATVRVICVRK
ncbi:peptidoglycan-binding protein [Bradyrhizobium sp. 83012]|uniref:Peptidoglycan-binding protein n=1 Tax=Bradyrhizobium aeschynomenes TaxID=2734909 RepID=A0ABX2CJT7_9BRAD|nr:peptidoglycan-binding domain-containing protein [Bradyrhizobium aeschynomenes]NPU68479.1 peptidoglycan-binding protein [Bradyrhizobium aeschynomenes]